MASLRYVVADVFTDRPLTGNQLAVFTDGRDVDDETMQKLAKEMNFSETVFVLPPEQGGHARIRIFTPVAELQFAGHPILGDVLYGPRPRTAGLVDRLMLHASMLEFRESGTGRIVRFESRAPF